MCFILGHPFCIVQNIDNKIYRLGFHLHFHLRSGVKEYAILWLIDEQRRKKKMSGRHSQISTMRMLMSSREPVNSWKLAGKKNEKSKIALMLQIGKNAFEQLVDPQPAAIPDYPIVQTVGDILQRRFDPLPNPYDDDADPHDTHPFLVSCLRNLLILAVYF